MTKSINIEHAQSIKIASKSWEIMLETLTNGAPNSQMEKIKDDVNVLSLCQHHLLKWPVIQTPTSRYEQRSDLQ